MDSQEAGIQETLQTPVLENGRPEVPSEESSRFTRDQLFTMAATGCLNFSSMICYSILGPFFPREAEKKGASDTVVGLIFGCFALSNFLTSLIVGNYLVQIGAKFTFVAGMFVSGCVTILFGMLDRAPDGSVFIGLCFLVRVMDATGFAAAVTASFSILAKAFPNNIATVMGSLETFTGLGLVLGPPIGGFLFQSFGYEVPFIVLGCIVLILVPLNMYLLPKYDALATKDSFWMLVTLPKVVFLCFTRFSLSACLGFLEPTMSLFVSEKYLRKWLLVFGGLLTALSFFLLGPAPILHIESKLWMFVLMLVLYGFSFGMSGIPLFPEILSCAYENGFEQGLSTLGLVSGLCGAMWSLGGFVGPTLGGFLNERLGFEWAAAIQGGWALLSGLAIGIFYILEASRRRRSSLQTRPGTNEERVHLLASEM
ncbi:MFS-type transporter SLC18B1-like isoform X3 [Mauremys reevesii]|uniref:MFS-type transporter SLC18B1-like isoform X3 n=1 Tax=Mauremys reevesii TaxID=260615 RepID=UPI00193F5F51|nr:MFS-type transporter SLC18B1-like isoform X3 [Mauremys reevesii]